MPRDICGGDTALLPLHSPLVDQKRLPQTIFLSDNLTADRQVKPPWMLRHCGAAAVIPVPR